MNNTENNTKNHLVYKMVLYYSPKLLEFKQDPLI